MLWTAIAIWLEPLRSTFDYGQINVFLALAVLWAVYSTRWWLSGLLVGDAAGIKLTPAIAGVYFVGARRWGAAVFSAVVFLPPIGVSALVVGDQTRYYFTDLLVDTDRVGTDRHVVQPVLARRHLPHPRSRRRLRPAGAGRRSPSPRYWPCWPGGRWTTTDRLGKLLVVELFGLLLSPISWTHHWVWLVPLMIWLIHGPLRDRRGARILGWGWLVLTIIGVPWLLSFAQPTIWQIGRPWYLAWAGLVYIVAALATLAWIAVAGSREAVQKGPAAL